MQLVPLGPLTPSITQAAIAGDRGALRHVFGHLMEWLPAAARRLYGNNLDPEELCQDTFTVVVRRIDSLGEAAKLDYWVMGILRRVAADHLKKERRRPRVLVADIELASALSTEPPMPGTERRSPETAAWRKQAVEIGERILVDLDPDAREAFILHLEGWSQTEIAGMTDSPRGTVASRLRRANRHVREASLALGLRADTDTMEEEVGR